MRHSNWRFATLLIGVGAALSACQPAASDKDHRTKPHLGRDAIRAIEHLDCPERQGGLTRISAAADEQSCSYTSSERTVDLRLVRLNDGDAEAALTPIETKLKNIIPTPSAPAKPPEAQGGKDNKNKTNIHLPNIHIDAHSDTADIRIGHLTINSDGETAEVKVNKNVNIKTDDSQTSVNVNAQDTQENNVTIKANDNGAEIRASKSGDAVRSTLILANDKAPNGYRMAGYETRGPKGGPLAVAVVKAKNRNTDDHNLFKNMKALVRHNVGG